MKNIVLAFVIAGICCSFLQDDSAILLGAESGVKGVDVSSYQGKINWSSVVSAGIKFAILRSTTKGGAMDSTFEYNYNNARANGISVSAYHFSYSLSTQQATNDAINLVNKLNGKKLPIYLDLEWDQQGKLSKQTVTDIAKAFINTLKNKGYEAHVYSNVDWYNNHYYPAQLKALGCKFWIAKYGQNTGAYVPSSKPNIGEHIWQYTSNGKVQGISGNVDLNMMYGAEPPKTAEKLIKVTVSVGVRRRDGPNGNIIGGYTCGTIVQIKGISKDGQWYIDSEGKYLTSNPEYVSDLVGRVNVDGLRIRAGPGTSETILGIVNKKDTITGLKKSGEWYYGNASTGVKGWVYGPYVNW